MLGNVRYETRIHRPAAQVWALAGDAARLHEWFPGIVACQVNGTQRVITVAAGLPLPEEIVCCDNILRRFQYRITAPIFQHHRGTIDVIDLGDDSCLVVYSTECDPRPMALVIGGGTAAALDELKLQMESGMHDTHASTEETD